MWIVILLFECDLWQPTVPRAVVPASGNETGKKSSWRLTNPMIMWAASSTVFICWCRSGAFISLMRILKHRAYSRAVFRLSAHTHMHYMNDNDKQKKDLTNKAYSRNNESKCVMSAIRCRGGWLVNYSDKLVGHFWTKPNTWSISLYCIHLFTS